jgi:hypothetical protein
MRLHESMNRPATSSEAHVDVARQPGTSPCYLRPGFAASHRRSHRRMTYPPPLNQHLRSRRIISPRPPTPPWITTNVGDTPRNISRQIRRKTRRPSRQSEGSTSTWYHQLQYAANMGVGLRQIYSPGHRSHHPNDAPKLEQRQWVLFDHI